MKSLLLLVACIVLCGCQAEPLKTLDSANKTVIVELLTTFDGVRLYRIFDGGRQVYVAVADGRLEVSWDAQHGKTAEHMRTTTVVKR